MAALLSLAGCGEAPVEIAAHTYLTPRAVLPSGERVPATDAVERLAQRHTEGRVDRKRTDVKQPTQAPLAPWTVSPAADRPGPRGGVLATATAPRKLVLAPNAAVPNFTAIELDLESSGGTTAHVTLEWQDGTQRVVEEWVPIRRERAPLVLYVGPVERRAELARVIVEPATEPARQFEVHSIALVDRGAPPSALRPNNGAQGWLPFAGLERLVWPQLAGAPLEATFELDRDQNLALRAWPGGEGVARARILDASTGAVVRELTARLTAEGAQLTTHLTARPGAPYRLELSGGNPGAPNRLFAYWEAPRLEPADAAARPAAGRPNVVLVTLDTTRADFTAAPAIAPNFHALSDLVFTNAYSVSNTTTPSHASILTGKLPHEHGAIAVGKYVLPDEAETLAEILRLHGYRTAAFTNVEHLDAAHGFAQGFDLFFQGGEPGSFDGLMATLAAERFLDDERAPFFIWLHLFDPHTPYLRTEELPPSMARFHDKQAHAQAGPIPRLAPDTPLPELGAPDLELPEWARAQVHLETFSRDEDLSDLARRYAGGVHYADALVGRFTQALRDAGELDETLIAITADHGESLGEAGVWANHAGLFPKNLHVPLGLHLPTAFAGLQLTPAQLAAPVSNHDLFPTILELLRIAGPAHSARTLLAPDPERILWFESDRLNQAARLQGHQLVITTLRTTRLYNDAERSALPAGTHMAFDLRRDPRGEHDLFPISPHQALLTSWAEEAARHALMTANPADLERALSPAEQKRLEELGYL